MAFPCWNSFKDVFQYPPPPHKKVLWRCQWLLAVFHKCLGSNPVQGMWKGCCWLRGELVPLAAYNWLVTYWHRYGRNTDDNQNSKKYGWGSASIAEYTDAFEWCKLFSSQVSTSWVKNMLKACWKAAHDLDLVGDFFFMYSDFHHH